MAIDHIEATYSDQIEESGITKRVYFQALIVFDDGRREWHYFGTKLSDIPARTADPAFEHAYVQFPQAFDDLQDVDLLLYELGRRAGFKREGLT